MAGDHRVRIDHGIGRATMLNWHGRHTLRPLIPGIVHERTDRHGSHPFAGERAQQGLQWLRLVLGWVKPLVERTWVENDRHPVMQRAHHLVGIRYMVFQGT